MSRLEITYGDMLCEKFPGCMSPAGLLFLREAERRTHYHVFKRKGKADGS